MCVDISADLCAELTIQIYYLDSESPLRMWWWFESCVPEWFEMFFCLQIMFRTHTRFRWFTNLASSFLLLKKLQFHSSKPSGFTSLLVGNAFLSFRMYIEHIRFSTVLMRSETDYSRYERKSISKVIHIRTHCSKNSVLVCVWWV